MVFLNGTCIVTWLHQYSTRIDDVIIRHDQIIQHKFDDVIIYSNKDNCITLYKI